MKANRNTSPCSMPPAELTQPSSCWCPTSTPCRQPARWSAATNARGAPPPWPMPSFSSTRTAERTLASPRRGSGQGGLSQQARQPGPSADRRRADRPLPSSCRFGGHNLATDTLRHAIGATTPLPLRAWPRPDLLTDMVGRVSRVARHHGRLLAPARRLGDDRLRCSH